MIRFPEVSASGGRAFFLAVSVFGWLLSSCAQLDTVRGLGEGTAAARLQGHVAYLASDRLEGRATGTEGFTLAANYVADSFAQSGLTPVVPNYRQPVPLYAVDPGSVTGSLRLTWGTEELPLELGDDVSFLPPSAGLGGVSSMEASGDLVFVGYGLDAPSLGYDSYGDLDVSGKIVVMLAGAPTIDDPAARVHLRRLDTKVLEAAQRGAAGVLYTDWRRRSAHRLTSLRRSHEEGALVVESLEAEAIPVVAISNDVLVELIAHTGRDPDTVLENVRDGDRESFAFSVNASLSVSASAVRVDTDNIIGLLPGADPDLQQEAVIITAHLDHLGKRRAGFIQRRDSASTDDIYNGALDNALGVAMLMEVADRLAAYGGLKRTVIFAAVTAEEAGLLGSQHLAQSIESLGYRAVANVNIDMPVMTYPFADVIGFGAEFSSLKDPLDAAAADIGVVATPDPVPHMSLFVRSDHYRFVQRGVPSVFLFNGMAGDGQAGFQAFMDEHYHQPSDQIDLPIRWDDAARFTDLCEDLIRRIATADEAPRWNEGAVFAP